MALVLHLSRPMGTNDLVAFAARADGAHSLRGHGVAPRRRASVTGVCGRRAARGPARLFVAARVMCLGLLGGLLVTACEPVPSRSTAAHPSSSAPRATRTPASGQAGTLTVQVADPHCPDGEAVGI